MKTISEKTIQATISQLSEKSVPQDKSRIEKGVRQAAMFWQEKDGKETDFTAFCTENFIPENNLEVLFHKLERNFELIYGHYNKLNVALMMPLHLNQGEITPIDMMFGSFSPYAHLADDFFENKIAFVVLLNFPNYTLDEKNRLGADWDAKQWAYSRLGDMYMSRVPAELIQKQSKVSTEADTYISEYNIYMGNLRDETNTPFFPAGMKLISHWGLRDELKAQYGQQNGLPKQKIIYEVMKRIITQEIPQQVINDSSYIWNPYSNKLIQNGKEIKVTPEPDTRYTHLKENFLAQKSMDAYNPFYPNYIARHFEGDMEMPQKEVEKLFIDFVSAPEIREIGKFISSRLGRNLEPFDLWYDGFKSRSNISQEVLDKIVQGKFPNVEAFQKGIADILKKLDFDAAKAEFIASRIKVDDSRGAGHAWGAAMKEDYSRLRTRAGEKGMNYKGFNIAMHELGHNVEQTITLHDVYSYFINGVPNTAFTEALAFMFQKRDMLIIGKEVADEDMGALDLTWSLYEIMGVSLVDMNLWKWLYEHPDASAAQIKEAVITISKDIWNTYYADVFGSKDQLILGIYSHMIDNPLYLSAYPVGHLVEFQVESAIKGKPFGKEIQKIYAHGRLTPEVWMLQNTGNKLSGKYLLKAASEAMSRQGKKSV